MRRELPGKPHIDHLKKQAKDLLDGHRRGEPHAVERMRAALPAFAGMSDAAVAHAPVALHDAQSAIAREYGFPSFRELRAEVDRRRHAAYPEAFVRSVMAAHPNAPLPDAVMGAMKAAWSAEAAAASSAGDEVTVLPLLASRNAVIVPGALVPLHLGRAASVAAVAAAQHGSPPMLAVFPQRDAAAEEFVAESLHPVGCHVVLHQVVPDADGKVYVVLRGLRWIRLEGLESIGSGHLIARFTAVEPEASDEPGSVERLFDALRGRARQLALALQQPAQALEMIEAIVDAERLADLVVANLPCTVDEKVRYGAEPKLEEKLRIALGLVEAALAAA